MDKEKLQRANILTREIDSLKDKISFLEAEDVVEVGKGRSKKMIRARKLEASDIVVLGKRDYSQPFHLDYGMSRFQLPLFDDLSKDEFDIIYNLTLSFLKTKLASFEKELELL